MDLSTIFDEPELAVLRALQHLCFDEVTIRTSNRVVQLTWEGDNVEFVWRVEAHLPDRA